MTAQERNEAMLLNLWNIGEHAFDGMLAQITKQVAKVDHLKKVVGYEYRSNNSSCHTVARLECGHERVFEYGYYPKMARCWDCPKLAEQPDEECERCFGHGEYILGRSDSDWGEVKRCSCPAGRKL